ncbi:MAG: MFS transporter [Chloroflexi bacterium]|nr:MFS transporter [Chloroflexota bacterium]
METRAKPVVLMVKAVQPYAWVILAASTIVMGASFLIRESLGPVAPFIQQGLGLSRAQFGLFFTAQSLGYMIVGLPLGQLSDIVGARRVLAYGVAVEGLFFILLGFAWNFPVALLFACFTGMGWSSVSPAVTKVIVYWFPLRLRGTAIGIKHSGVPLMATFGAATLPTIAILLSWRWALASVGVFMILCGVVTYLLYREYRDETFGVLSLGTWLAGIRRVLSNHDVLTFCFGSAFFSVTHQVFIAYFALYLHEQVALSEVVAGFYLAIGQGAAIVGRLFWGVASDSIFTGGRKVPLLLITLIAFGASLVAILYGPQTPSWALVMLSIVMGLSLASWGGLSQTLVAELAGKEQSATAAALAGTFGGFSMATGPVIFGYLVDRTGSYGASWLFTAGCAITAFALLTSVREERRRA